MLCTSYINFFKVYVHFRLLHIFIVLVTGVSGRAPISNVEAKNVGLAGFTHRAIVRTETVKLSFFYANP